MGDALRCTERVVRDKTTSWCHRLAAKDPIDGTFTKCGTHCNEATARRNQKRNARYAEEKAADDKRWDAEDAREELVVEVREMLDDFGERTGVNMLGGDCYAKLQALVKRATT